MAKRDGERVPWLKLFVDYSSTPSHDDLDDRALWTGVALMLLIRAGCDARDDRQPWALLESGAPCSLNAIARRARQHHQVAQRGLLLLQAAGTVAQREDGAWGMPKFWHHQETKWAKQKRGQRSGQSAPKSAGRPRQEKKSSPSENEDREDQPPPTPPVEGSGGVLVLVDDRPGRRGAGRRPPAKPDERAATVLDRVDFHRVRLALAPMTAGQRTAKTIASRLREGASLEQCLAVVDAFGRLADREPGKRTLLNATTPFTGASSERGGGWAWGLRMLDEEAASGVRPSAPTEMPEWMRDA